MTEMYTLYGRAGSGSFAVQVALQEIGAPYECVWIAKDEESIVRFRQVNPTGRVPALRLPDGTLMFESAAMLIHLAAAHPESHLAPTIGTSEHARFLQWMVFLSANAYESVLRIYYAARYSSRGDADGEAIAERGKVEFLEHLELIGRGLNPYVLGANYSIADAYLHMLAAWYPGDQSELRVRIPRLAAHAARLSSRPAIQKATAHHTDG